LELVYLYENRYIDKQLKSYDVLIEHIRQTPKLHTCYEMDFKGLKPKNYCGFLSVANQSYFIIPKITEDILTELGLR